MCSLLLKYWKLNKYDKKLFWVAIKLLLIALIWVRLRELKKFEKRIGDRGKEEKVVLSESDLVKIKSVRNAIQRAKKIIPWRVKCFEEAIAAKILLRKQNIKSSLYLGATFEGKENLKAHAWLKCGEVFVTGQKGHRNFKIVNLYS